MSDGIRMEPIGRAHSPRVATRQPTWSSELMTGYWKLGDGES